MASWSPPRSQGVGARELPVLSVHDELGMIHVLFYTLLKEGGRRVRRHLEFVRRAWCLSSAQKLYSAARLQRSSDQCEDSATPLPEWVSVAG